MIGNSMKLRAVLDTNVLVAAFMSRSGASFRFVNSYLKDSPDGSVCWPDGEPYGDDEEEAPSL